MKKNNDKRNVHKWVLLRIIRNILIVALIIFAAYYLLVKLDKVPSIKDIKAFKKEKKENAEYQLNKSEMENICQLAVIDNYYHNVAMYDKKHKKYKFWDDDTKFWIEYSGIATYGIEDVSKVTYDIKGNKVKVKLPRASLISINVDENSLNEGKIYVAADSKEPTANAQKKAYKDAQSAMKEEAINDTASINNANARVKELIENYIVEIGKKINKDYKVEFEYID